MSVYRRRSAVYWAARPRPRWIGTASAAQAVTGTGAGTLTAATGAASAAETFAATAVGTLQAATGAASGAQTFAGTAAGTLAATTGAASGAQTFTATAAGTLAATTGAASGAETFAGTAVGTLAAVTGAAAGWAEVTGTAAGTVAAATGAAAGAETFAGAAAGTLAALTGSASGIFPTYVRLAPNTIVAGGDNLQDTLTNSPPTRLADIDEDVASDDTEWWTAVDPELATDVRLGFSTPTGNPTGNQIIRALVRATGATGPNVTLELWEGGAKLTSETTVQVTSESGQIVELSFDASELSDPTGAGVEVRIVSEAA